MIMTLALNLRRILVVDERSMKLESFVMCPSFFLPVNRHKTATRWVSLCLAWLLSNNLHAGTAFPIVPFYRCFLSINPRAKLSFRPCKSWSTKALAPISSPNSSKALLALHKEVQIIHDDSTTPKSKKKKTITISRNVEGKKNTSMYNFYWNWVYCTDQCPL